MCWRKICREDFGSGRIEDNYLHCSMSTSKMRNFHLEDSSASIHVQY